MRQTNSSTLVQPSPSPPPPPPPTMLSRVSTLYWWKERGAGKQRILKLVTVVFLNSVLKTSKIGAITQVSQGILSTIVALNEDSCGEYHYRRRLMSYSRYWTGTSLEWRLMQGNIVKRRLMSYSRHWTGTSLQWRLVRGNIIKKK